MRQGANKGTILLIDDSPTVLKMVAPILEAEGYIVNTALSGVEGIKSAEVDVPDLILLDIVMPGIDGYEVARHIKSHAKLRLLPIIFLTGKTAAKDIVKGFECGCVDYIVKPFNTAVLIARVKTHINLKQARDEIDTLRGIIPICSRCKKIREDSGYWEEVETYIQNHSEAQFSHGYCPSCEEEQFANKSWWRKKHSKSNE